MSKAQCRNCEARVDSSAVFHVMRSVGGSSTRASGRRKSTICVDCARNIVNTSTPGHTTRSGWTVSNLQSELKRYGEKQPTLGFSNEEKLEALRKKTEANKQAASQKSEFNEATILNSGLQNFRRGDRMSEDELRLLAKRFATAANALAGITEYDIARRAAIHDWNRVYSVAQARGVKITML